MKLQESCDSNSADCQKKCVASPQLTHFNAPLRTIICFYHIFLV